MLGASRLKMMAGGGVSSDYDPLDVTQYTERELRAGVEAAENWGTYVMVHAYTPRSIQQALRAGVRSWGTDTLFSADLATKQGEQLAKMTRWFIPAQVLTMATSSNADLLVMSGARNPYPAALGRVVPGAFADLLLVDGDPLVAIGLLADPTPTSL